MENALKLFRESQIEVEKELTERTAFAAKIDYNASKGFLIYDYNTGIAAPLDSIRGFTRERKMRLSDLKKHAL